ncbi:hypothetical protein [Lihuaxuella thermophila]|uniref:ABC-type transport system involved in multi-copper enzyme maturation, permease component n=1 Tax=Lihuaxuella thermophila TaxID=1173111 RepID=A0A1H8G7W1_9BACL|nr:hypothetical protein [Lihuaxuella thermophila]SEN39824.1 hypothetical protein SAMN05444955_110122 [Lihuaxuella thermophila]
MKTINSWKVEMLLISRSLWTWLVFVAAAIVVVIQYQTHLEMNDPGRAVTSTAFIVLGGLFASMILGLTLVRNEHVSSSYELFHVIDRGYFAKIWGKWLALLTCVVTFSAIAALILFCMYFIYNVPSVFYSQAVFYLLLYWVIPFLVAGMVGMVSGLLMRSRLVFAVLTVIWLLTGPLNYDIFSQFFFLVPSVDPTPLMDFLNLGQTNPYEPFDPIYGFPMEIPRWIQKGIIGLGAAGFFILTAIIKCKVKFTMRWAIVFAVMVLSLTWLSAEYAKESQVIYTGNRKYGVLGYDWHYYKKHPVPSIQDQVPFDVSSYDVKLNVYRKLSVNLDMVVVPREKGRKLVFTLYRDLKVKKVTSNGNSLSYRQSGDQIEVQLSTPINLGESLPIHFEYEGISSPFYFANEQAVMLPGYYAWLPVPGAHPVMRYEESLLFPNDLSPKAPVHYRLTYEGPEPLYSNLKKTGENRFEDTVAGGITLVGGKYVTSRTVNGTTFVYPKSFYKLESELEEMERNYRGAVQLVSNDLWISKKQDSKILFLLSLQDESETTHLLWHSDRYAILKIQQFFNDDSRLLKDRAFFIRLTASSFVKSSPSGQEIQNLFSDAYLYWVEQREPGWVQDGRSGMSQALERKRKTLEMMQGTLDQKQLNQLKEEISIYEDVIKYVNEKNTREIREFFRDFHFALNQPKTLTWDEVRKLMKEGE